MIRKPSIEEVATIAKYNRDAAVEAGNKPLDLEKSIKGVRKVIETPDIGFFLVYEKNNEIASMLLITFEWSDWRNGNWYLVQSVYTQPKYRKQWLFKALLKDVERYSKEDENSCWLKLEVLKDNEKAQTVYKKLGFIDSLHYVYVNEK